MTALQSVSYIELDIPFCSLTYGVAPCTASLVSSPPTGTIKCFNSRRTCQDIANFDPADVTLRFAKPASFLPRDIDCVPSISDISYTPSSISLGNDLGTRATLSVTFRDHPHSDTGEGYDKYRAERGYDPYSQGTFWGKFRARQPFLRGQALRWITGLVGQDIADMETRHFIVDSFDGPTPDGKFTIVAKDVLKLADGDRAQAPALSSGFLVADITAVDSSLVLSPSGIGLAEYPASGFAAIGGKEIVSFTRSGDTLTIVRARSNSIAQAHKAQDRVQLMLVYDSEDPADIIYDLLVNYAGVPASFITLTDWQEETANFLGVVYSAEISEPTSLSALVSELIQQACLAVWWDDLNQKIRLQVLRAVLTEAKRFTPDNTIQATLKVKEQPEKRISRVQTYFGRILSLRPVSEPDNYRSSSLVIDDDAETDYGAAAIKTIMSRWIPALGRSVADRLGQIQLARYRDPPRRVEFAVQRYAETDVEVGGGYKVEAHSIQDATGAASEIPIQVTRLNPGPDRFSVEAEEMLFAVPDVDLNNRLVIVDSNINNIDLRAAHDTIYPEPQSGDEVTFIVNSGVVVGSAYYLYPAVDVGSWPAGVTITLILSGRMQGKGGQAGNGGNFNAGGGGGGAGGPALYTRYPINLEFPAGGELWGGGGGGAGGGGGGGTFGGGGGGGGGGAGTDVGSRGAAGNGNPPGLGGSFGSNGTASAGGAGGFGGAGGLSGGGPSGNGAQGGDGGAPGAAGGNSSAGDLGGGAGALGGAAGAAIDGISYVTITVSGGDLRGPTIN